jgi:HD-GYP domain-containing protein (c-di-GMP phosphodiesterase class II)
MHADCYLTKPSIARTIRYAIDRKRLENDLRTASQALAELNAHLETKVLEKSAALARESTERAQLEIRLESERRVGAEQLQQTYLDTIGAIALALGKRSLNISGGQRRASALAVAMARAMGLAEERVEGLRIGGLLFDLGMMTVPPDTSASTAAAIRRA